MMSSSGANSFAPCNASSARDDNGCTLNPARIDQVLRSLCDTAFRRTVIRSFQRSVIGCFGKRLLEKDALTRFNGGKKNEDNERQGDGQFDRRPLRDVP